MSLSSPESAHCASFPLLAWNVTTGSQERVAFARTKLRAKQLAIMAYDEANGRPAARPATLVVRFPPFDSFALVDDCRVFDYSHVASYFPLPPEEHGSDEASGGGLVEPPRAALNGYHLRTTRIEVLPVGSALSSEATTVLEIVDDGAGEFMRVSQSTDTEADQTVSIDPLEWPAIQQAVNFLMAEIEKHSPKKDRK